MRRLPSCGSWGLKLERVSLRYLVLANTLECTFLSLWNPCLFTRCRQTFAGLFSQAGATIKAQAMEKLRAARKRFEDMKDTAASAEAAAGTVSRSQYHFALRVLPCR